jgi:peptidoglycan/xylan/chitin deacetylase (PgdA/CDA1 family)
MSPDTLVLCYHAVGDAVNQLTVSPERLERQLRGLARRGYVPDLASNVVRSEPSRRRVVVTFDDGYRSVRKQAAPVLRHLGVAATMFVTTEFVGRAVGVAAGDSLDSTAVSWDDLRALADEGWEIGSHTLTHPRLTALGAQEVRMEVCESKARIEAELGRPCSSFAYPWGLVDEHVEHAVRRAGYEVAFTVPRRMGLPLTFQWPRVTVLGSDGPARFAVKTSRTMRLVRRSRIGATAASVAGNALSGRVDRP